MPIVPLFFRSSSICLPPSHLLTISSRESCVDRIRQNDESLTEVAIFDQDRSDAIENLAILDALKNNTSVKWFHFVQLNKEELVKLSEVMKCNKSVVTLSISLERGMLGERLFATMATSDGWSSIQTLYLAYDRDDDIEHQSYMDAEHISNFIIQSENLRTLHFIMDGDDAVPIVDTFSRTNTKVQSLEILFGNTFSAGGRRLATALEIIQEI